jgi:hypothetical protein
MIFILIVLGFRIVWFREFETGEGFGEAGLGRFGLRRGWTRGGDNEDGDGRDCISGVYDSEYSRLITTHPLQGAEGLWGWTL